MPRLRTALLIVAGLIHLMPLPGLVGGPALARLYGLDSLPPDLEILLRHRAVMFGLLGALLVGAAFRPEWRPLAMGAGLISAVAFIALAAAVGGYGPAIRRVVVADLVAVACLLGALAIEWHRHRTP